MTRTLWAITAVFAVQLFSRGMDYLLGNPAQGAGIFQMDQIEPPVVWGSVCVLNALIIGAGLCTHRLRIVRDGAVLAVAVYLAFALMVFDEVYVHSPVDDWRFFTGYLSAAALWAIIAWSLTVRMAVVRHRQEVDNDA